MKHAALRTLLLTVATLGLPIACGLSIDEVDGDYPGAPPAILPPIAGNPPQSSEGSAGVPGHGGSATAGIGAAGSTDLAAAGSTGLAGSVDAGGVPGNAGNGGAGGVTIDAGTSAPQRDGGCSSGDDCRPPALCLSNDECDDGLCVNNACRGFCSDDSECRSDEGCVLGLCRASAEGFECIAAADCPDSDDCVGGSCLQRCLSAEHCVSGDDGPSCKLGYCGP